MPISVNLTYRADISQPLTWVQGDANFKTLADNDVFLNNSVEASALAATNANNNANGRQPSNPKLTAIAASVWAANQMLLTTGTDTISMIPVNSYGLTYLNFTSKNDVRSELSINNVDNTSDADKPISTAVQTALDLKINNSQRGVANGVAALGADGKLPPSQLPPLAVNETFIVNSQAEQLALIAERGDMAFRTDQANTPYVLTTDDPSVFANWKSLDKTLSDSLAALNVLTPAADRIPFFTGALTAGLQVLSSIGKTLLSAADKLSGRTAIDAAKLGDNSDITSLNAMTTPLTVAQGGTNRSTIAAFISDLLTAGVYGKANAVGIVSQASGVPTGAIIEYSEDGNGSTCTRYADGTQVCTYFFRSPTVYALDTAVGSLWRTRDAALLLPDVSYLKPFATGKLPVLSYTCRMDSWYGFPALLAGTRLVTKWVPSHIVSLASVSTFVEINCIATGRWN